jgi:hypothetical protein
MALGCALLLSARSWRQLTAVGAVVAVAASYFLFTPVGQSSSNNEVAQLFEGFMGRAQSQALEDVDRFEHMRIGINLLAKMDTSHLFLGSGPEVGVAATNGDGIHNMLIGMAVCYGLIATSVFTVGELLLGYHALAKLADRAKTSWQENIGSKNVIMWLIVSWGTPGFYDFRNFVSLGPLVGLVLWKDSPAQRSTTLPTTTAKCASTKKDGSVSEKATPEWSRSTAISQNGMVPFDSKLR